MSRANGRRRRRSAGEQLVRPVHVALRIFYSARRRLRRQAGEAEDAVEVELLVRYATDRSEPFVEIGEVRRRVQGVIESLAAASYLGHDSSFLVD